MASEDITFCANKNCRDMNCYRNPKHIKLLIDHSFSMFTNCPKWKDAGDKWLIKQMENEREG